jgi:hypothetical protein
VAGAEGAEPHSPAQQLLDQLQQVARSQEQQQVLYIWAAQGMNSAGEVQDELYLNRRPHSLLCVWYRCCEVPPIAAPKHPNGVPVQHKYVPHAHAQLLM